MIAIYSGALVACYMMAGLFFLRFWTTSRDRLFGMFAASFGILAIQRLALSLTHDTMEDQTVFYLMRLAAFVLIIIAIVDKNRR